MAFLLALHLPSKCLAWVACLWSKMPKYVPEGGNEGGRGSTLNFKILEFWSQWRDITTKLKSQGLHITRIKYWNASGSGSPPFLIPALWNIGILFHKHATLGKPFCPECIRQRVPRKNNGKLCWIYSCNPPLINLRQCQISFSYIPSIGTYSSAL